MKSRVLSRSAFKFSSFGGGALFSVSSIDQLEKKTGDIIGHHGALSKWTDKKETAIHRSTECGFEAVAALSTGQLAIASSDYAISIFSADGRVEHRLDTEFGAPTDWLAAGGAPQRLFGATAWSGSKKSPTVVEFTVGTWARKHLSFRSSFTPSMSEIGVSRVNKDKRIAEYEWEGAPKPKTPVVAGPYGQWTSVRVDDGWLIHDVSASYFVDLSGAKRWSGDVLLRKLPNFTEDEAVARGNRLLLVTGASIHLTDGPSRGTRVAIASEAGLELVEDLPLREASKGRSTAAASVRVPKPTEPDPLELTVDKLEARVDEICATEEVKVIKAAHGKIAKLDILEASDEPKRAKRIEKAIRKVRAHLKSTKQPGASREL